MISGLEAEAILLDLDRLDDLAAEGLVARLHVGEVEVGEHVRQQRQEPVAERVPEVQDPVRATRQEPRAEHDVGPAGDRGARAGRPYSAGSYSRSASWTMTNSAVAAAKPVRSAAPLPRLRSWRMTRTRGSSATPAEHVGGAVGGAVVDDDDLGGPRGRQHPVEERGDGRRLVEAGHDDRQARPRPAPGAVTGRRRRARTAR